MENERLRITLDKPDKIYFAGQTIKGEIWMNLNKRAKIRAIKVQITGKGKCRWMEVLRKNSNNEASSRSLFYSSKEIYAHGEHALQLFEPRGLELNSGEHTFEFSMPLEWTLPSSFKGSYGSIKYKLRILIQRPWTLDERHMIPLTIVKHMPLPYVYRLNPNSLEKQITKTISLFGTRPITMLALLPEDFAVRGEPLRICVTVTNNSTTNVEKLRFSVLQYICYYSHVPLRVQKLECIAIATKETGQVHKKTERSFAHELLIPYTAQPSDDQFSGVINISYELRVEAVLRGFFKNLIVNLPFKMYGSDGTNEFTTTQPPQLPPMYPQETAAIAVGSRSGGGGGAGGVCGVGGDGNPFETTATHYRTQTNIAMLPVYPSLDSSIGSPSHSSSQYTSGEESSSINSTTSDSSAATLSPAIGNSMNLSYSSGASSQFNSPSARASLRGSNVPYMPYSSSPMMVNSYPPPHVPSSYALPESPQYMLMMPASTPPTHNNINSTIAPASISAALSMMQRRQPPPGAHEMPPTYEELFGGASAPPETPK